MITTTCQDPDTKSIPLQSNGSAIHYHPFILGFTFYYHPYYSLPTSFHSILVHLLASPFYQQCYTCIIKYQPWLHSDSILSKQCMFHSETQHPRLLYCFFLFHHFIYVSLLSGYIILSFVLCTLVLKINLASSHSSFVNIYWIFSSLLLEISILYFWNRNNRRVGWHST